MQTTPESLIQTQKDLENTIESYRGQIMLQETSIVTNKKVLVSQEHAITENHLALGELKDFIASAQKNKDSLIEDNASLEEAKIEKTNTVNMLNLEIESLSRKIAEESKAYEEKKKALESLENKNTLYAESLTQREAVILEKENKVDEKHSKIKSFIETL